MIGCPSTLAGHRFSAVDTRRGGGGFKNGMTDSNQPCLSISKLTCTHIMIISFKDLMSILALF